MASSPKFKVYNSAKEYIGSTKHAEDAACLAEFQGSGATVRYNHKHIVWTVGAEEIEAHESYDIAAEVMHKRIGLSSQAASEVGHG